MNRSYRSVRFLALSLLVLLAGCASYGGNPQFEEMDFPAIIAGRGFIAHIDASGNASAQVIDFLKDEAITQWDVASLDQIVTTDRIDALASGNYFDIKYYKNKAFTRSFRIENARYILWVVLVPEKNCLVLETMNGGTVRRLMRVDLVSGKTKEKILGVFPSIDCKPVWDKANGNLIVVVESKDQTHLDQFNHPFPYDSLARLDVDDLTIQDNVALDDVQINGLLFADAGGKHVTAYGMMGGWPLFLTGTPGIIDFDLATGKPTMVMKDTMPGMFMYDYIGIAAVNRQYVLLTKVGGYSSENPKSYCVDLKNQGWRELSEIPPFRYPISHDGLLLASPSGGAK